MNQLHQLQADYVTWRDYIEHELRCLAMGSPACMRPHGKISCDASEGILSGGDGK
jgi:hypothetical protein